MSNGITNTSKRSLKNIEINISSFRFLFKLETLYQSKKETLNEKEMRIGDRFKSELDV
jgi:hypothetical protein